MAQSTRGIWHLDDGDIEENIGGKEGNETRYYFSTRLNNLLKDRGITQTQLSANTGISYGAISQYRNGLREPTITFLNSIAKFLGVSADYLLGNEKIESPAKIDKEINKKTGLSSEAIEALRYYSDIFSELTEDKSPVEALNTLFIANDEMDISDGVSYMDFFWHLRKYFFTTKEELEVGLLSMNYIQADGGYEIITEEDLEENLLRRIEKRLRYYRKMTQDKLQAEKLKDIERANRRKKPAESEPE